MDWIITLAAGAVGGNIGGALFKKLSLGPLLNSVAGIIGGALGMWVNSLEGTTGWIHQLGGGAVGGVIVMGGIGLIKRIMSTAPQPT